MKIERFILATTPYWDEEDYDFPPMTVPMERREESLAQVIDLYDGSEAIIFPPVNTREENFDIAIFEAEVTGELLSTLRNYRKNGDGIRITLPTGEKLEGYIMRLSWTYTASGKAMRRALAINFKPFDVDNSGQIGD